MTKVKTTLKQMAEDLGYVRAFGKYWESDYFYMWEEYGSGPCGIAMGWETNNRPLSSEELKEKWSKEMEEETQ